MIFLNIFVYNKGKSVIFAASKDKKRLGRVHESSRPFQPQNKRGQRKGFKMTTNTKTKKTYEPIPDLEGEVWRDVVGFDGFYQVSNKGRVKSLNFGKRGYERLLSQAKHKNYLFVTLTKEGKHKSIFVHRLVYEAFIGNVPKYNTNISSDELIIVNHKDECGTNNNVENLELLSVKDNNRYGTKPSRIAHTLHKKVIQKTLDCVVVKEWESAISCEEYGFSRKAISACCHGRIRTHKGYIWSFTPLLNNY